MEGCVWGEGGWENGYLSYLGLWDYFGGHIIETNAYTNVLVHIRKTGRLLKKYLIAELSLLQLKEARKGFPRLRMRGQWRKISTLLSLSEEQSFSSE